MMLLGHFRSNKKLGSCEVILWAPPVPPGVLLDDWFDGWVFGWLLDCWMVGSVVFLISHGCFEEWAMMKGSVIENLVTWTPGDWIVPDFGIKDSRFIKQGWTQWMSPKATGEQKHHPLKGSFHLLLWPLKILKGWHSSEILYLGYVIFPEYPFYQNASGSH